MCKSLMSICILFEIWVPVASNFDFSCRIWSLVTSLEVSLIHCVILRAVIAITKASVSKPAARSPQQKILDKLVFTEPRYFAI